MRIETIDTWVVNVPLTSAFASSFETKSGTTRTVLRLRTDDGAVGWGETMHGAPTRALVDRLKTDLVGLDPHDLATMRDRLHMVPFFYGYLGYAALAGIEMACYDVITRAAGVPLRDMLGGAYRDEVPVSGLLTRADGDVVDAAAGLRERWGFRALKLKGTTDITSDVALLQELRVAQADVALRVDPNAHWSVQDTLRAGPELEELRLEYLEDPCEGIEGMAEVRRRLRIPLCTNMCVVRMEDFAPGLRSVDVIHGDVHKWGGIEPTRRLAGLCAAFGLGMNMHSGGELGISTAVHLAVAAATPEISYAIDSMYYLLADDILTEQFTVADGQLTPPSGPGIGVQVDEAKLAHYAAVNEREGDHTM